MRLQCISKFGISPHKTNTISKKSAQPIWPLFNFVVGPLGAYACRAFEANTAKFWSQNGVMVSFKRRLTVSPQIGWLQCNLLSFPFSFCASWLLVGGISVRKTHQLDRPENVISWRYTYHPTWANQLYFHFPSGMKYSTLLGHFLRREKKQPWKHGSLKGCQMVRLHGNSWLDLFLRNAEVTHWKTGREPVTVGCWRILVLYQ